MMHVKKIEYSGTMGSKEFLFTQNDFDDITQRIYKLAGIVLQEHKQDMVYSRLARRLRILNFKSFAEYRKFLDSSEGRNEVQSLVNALTTNLTSFFREEHHFVHLEKNLEQIIQKGGTHKIRIWCSAASTGQEPYSIAMIADKVGLNSPKYDFKILATDLDTIVLQKAEQGLYEGNHTKKLSTSLRDKYLIPQADNMFLVHSKLKDMIIFKQLNLLGNWPMKGSFDIIFCRNVLIYFDMATRIAIISKMKDLLPIGGILYLGHSEAYPLELDTVSNEGHTIFRKLK